MSHKKIIVANWKMNLLPSEEKELFSLYLTLTPHNKKIIVTPSFLSLKEFSPQITNHPFIELSAQTCSPCNPGAHTGDISAAQLANIQTHFCLVGHLERKNSWKENNATRSEQIKQLLKNNLIPIVCLESPEDEKDFLEQLAETLSSFEKPTLYFAFEPRGAIGTGAALPLEGIQKEVETLQKLLKNLPLSQPKILYGGSVSAENADLIMNIKGVDGLLVGGKSLNFQEWKKIVD